MCFFYVLKFISVSGLLWHKIFVSLLQYAVKYTDDVLAVLQDMLFER